MSATASTSKANTPAAPDLAKVETEVERLLAREATAFQRDVEVERILKAFKLNPYDILDLEASCSTDDIKRKYRQLSLFIHPDKAKHPKAPEAFDILKKAEGELSDEKRRDDLDATIRQARIVVLKSLSLPTNTPDNDPALTSLNPSFSARLRAQAKEMLIDEEVRRRKAIKLNLANEGREARQKEEEVATKKRKAEDDKAWEERREERVGSWRNFASTQKKKKKSNKPALLG
ncbi:DnaJ-domain-containing protein [Schizophyllum commune H4-8]|uniref:J domain-containing protein n=1 Tax=Schizophyllum commune (strain H4-8 / FGSC 9210) TaxID=578458 RepID=D8QIK2_SCHCM|nr:DnaJ-domain-containing protein [Schizophyllum commune H4-8]KAI5886028.1 DnaJ-domain-containing protein [Schizophyllum commune H4-8]